MLLPFELVAFQSHCCCRKSTTTVAIKRTIIQATTTSIQEPSFSTSTGINMASPTIKTCKSIDPKEEYLVDLDTSIPETILTLSSLNQINQTILDNSNIISNSFCTSMSIFTLEPTFLHPEFVH